jgi:amino acid permease
MNALQMFSILNEIKDYSPASILGVISSSIGSAASIYILVAITGYMTFGNDVHPNIISMYPPSVASTIGKAAIVIMVMFSVPLQHHPCRASVDAVLRWRPNKSQSLPTAARSSSPQPLMSSSASVGGASNHGSPVVAMSDLRFAIITSVILIGSYLTALTVSSFDRVLAYVGSTGSTSISFILPGLFYYKISDPDSIHHQRLTKEDDDADLDDNTVVEGEGTAASSGLLGSVASIRSAVSGVSRRKKWRWDLEHLETGLLRKLALCLSVYGVLVMVVCLSINMFAGGGSH